MSAESDVPSGTVEGPFQWRSAIFPGTVRDYWIYVPSQYDAAAKPACVIVVQDGLGRAKGWRLTEALDALIHTKEVPVTIGIFIDPGVVPAPHENAQARFNRSFEYDALGDRYARFLIEEILPAVAKRYNLSQDPNERAIAGASSGAICAFNAAWERPDAFRRVLSTIGTYVGLRDGHNFPMLIRKTEPKPLRIFLQGGKHDLDLYPGSWWIANQDMLSACTWAGYDVKHAWGDGGHDSEHAARIMPDALRWLWRDYPKPIEPGVGAKRLMEILIPGESWQLVSSGHRFTEGPAVNTKGEVFFTDTRTSQIFRIATDGNVEVFAGDTGNVKGLMFGADGRLFATANGSRQIVAYTPDGTPEVMVSDTGSNDLVVTPSGIIYTDPDEHRVRFVDFQGNRRILDEGIKRPNGIILSPDRSQLYVADTHGQFVYAFQVKADGSLTNKQRFFHLHIPYGHTDSGADGMAVDAEGRLYVATRMGLQVCDQVGRVHLILSKPQPGWLSNVIFAGPQLDTLYVTCEDKVFRRRIRARGVLSWGKAVKPPKPRPERASPPPEGHRR